MVGGLRPRGGLPEDASSEFREAKESSQVFDGAVESRDATISGRIGASNEQAGCGCANPRMWRNPASGRSSGYLTVGAAMRASMTAILRAMATAKKASATKAPANVSMDAWYAKPDPHAVVEAQKKRLRGKPRGLLATLQQQRNLGVALLALGRTKDGLSVLDEAAAAVRPSSRTDPWFIGAACAALAHWVRERAGKTDATRLMKFTTPAAHAWQDLQPALGTKARFAKELREHWRAFEDGKGHGADAIDTMAFHLAEIAFLRELHVLAPIHTHKIATTPTDAAMKRALGVVKTVLAG